MCETWLKHAIIIEDCDVIFITTSILKVMLAKKWDLTIVKPKLAKNLLKVRNFVEFFLIDIWQIQLWTNILYLGIGMLFLANRKSGARDSGPIHGTRDLGPSTWDPSSGTWDPRPIVGTWDLYMGPKTWDPSPGTRDPGPYYIETSRLICSDWFLCDLYLRHERVN